MVEVPSSREQVNLGVLVGAGNLGVIVPAYSDACNGKSHGKAHNWAYLSLPLL